MRFRVEIAPEREEEGAYHPTYFEYLFFIAMVLFPEKKPDYDAAFVFVEDEYNNPDVPPWAIKLVLQKDEI